MTDKSELFHSLVEKTRKILETSASRDEKLKSVCKLLRRHVSYYNWVGFYLVEKEAKKQLILGPFEGEPTAHTRIPFGRGICGQAAERRETFVVQDISKEANYLSCSVNVKSEVVVPIFKEGQVVGELDIDSHRPSPFTKEDIAFVNKIAKIVSAIF